MASKTPKLDHGSDDARGHVPVMLDEVLDVLALAPGHVVVDCTAGGGGHLGAFAERVGPTGRVIGLDRDPRAHLDDAAGGVARRYADRVQLVQRPFSEVREALVDARVDGPVDALFADLGVSSFQLDEGARGFSFRADAPLDMRMDPTQGESARALIERLDEEELANVIYELGEERHSRRVARALKRAPVPTTTTEAASRIAGAVGAASGGAWQRIHPATRTFQALRIAVNGELTQLDTLLDALPQVVRKEGRVAFLTFHSLEDRRVKQCFKSDAFAPITKKPHTATDDELEHNPRARSAKLRAAIVGGSKVRRNKYPRSEDSE
jgi:16S rRNA (cytosine1402-N4)-methyltransferase